MKWLISTLAVGWLIAVSHVLPAAATGQRPCDELFYSGKQECYSAQFAFGMATPEAVAAQRRDPMATAHGLADGSVSPAGQRCVYYYMWMKPGLYKSRNLPADLMRIVRFNGAGERDFSIHHLTSENVVVHKDRLPSVEDPRYPAMGDPDFVLKVWSGSYGVGFNYPKFVRDQVFMTQTCPCTDVTAYPDRINHNYGYIVTPSDFDRIRGADHEWNVGGLLFFR